MNRLRRLVTPAGAALLALSASAAAQETHLLIVAGLGGEPQYAESFRAWSAALQASAEKRLGIPRSHITLLAESAGKDLAGADGRSTREELQRAFGQVAARCRPGDTVAVVLFGHGSGAGEEARFNLPGPDASARDFASWLSPFELQRIVFVNTASASGDFQKVLAGKNRIVLTSTRSSQERNEAVFGRYFSEALSSDAADADKNGQVSILEAFEAAKAQVATEYQRERRLLTEHAVLEDGEGGSLARRTFLGSRATGLVAGSPASSDPAIAALEAERRALEDRVEALKASKGSLPDDRYEAELERLLLDLALKNEEIRKRREGGKP
ncbi:MAG: hypothetical protein K1Y01_19735 [Vicinamibacteria bacterium]|nr:hypothetical protein [Vicinamibacteria bacterium]